MVGATQDISFNYWEWSFLLIYSGCNIQVITFECNFDIFLYQDLITQSDNATVKHFIKIYLIC